MPDLWREQKQLTLAQVKERAAEQSKDCGGCVQHVNKRDNGTYYVSDWFDSDSTVASFVNGKEKD